MIYYADLNESPFKYYISNLGGGVWDHAYFAYLGGVQNSGKPSQVILAHSLIRSQVSGNLYQVTHIGYQVSGNMYQVDSFRLQVCGCMWNQEGATLLLSTHFCSILLFPVLEMTCQNWRSMLFISIKVFGFCLIYIYFKRISVEIFCPAFHAWLPSSLYQPVSSPSLKQELNYDWPRLHCCNRGGWSHILNIFQSFL